MSPMVSREMTIELALLGFVRAGSVHGYQIYQSLKEPEGLSQVWRLKQSSLYATLSRLEQGGLIHGDVEVQETRPSRRIYRLTPKGLATYQEWLTSPVNTPRQVRQEFMAKLYFARLEGEPTLNALVENQLRMCESWLERHHNQFASAPPGSFQSEVYRYRLGQIQATLAWLRQLKLEASVNNRSV